MLWTILSVLLAIAGLAFVAYRKVFPKKKKFTKTKLDAVVISGPAGVGKGTLIKKLMDSHPGKFGFSVSHTTRDPRPGEVDGVHYHFVTREKFESMIKNGEFLEHADVQGKMYGTSKAAVDKVRRSGAVCILEVDVKGAERLKSANFSCYFIFVRPPSFEVLRERMLKRGAESEDKIQTRLQTARQELDFIAEKGRTVYDKIMENDSLEVAYKSLEGALKLYGALTV